jgi:two-component system, NarL family, response regulator LiaR
VIPSIPALPDGPPPGTPIPVAIVDDEGAVRMSLRQLLGSNPSYACVGVYSRGRAALDDIPRIGARLVLMDIRMPGMSGIECTRRLVRELSNLTVVMVTAAFGEQVTRESIQAGCRGYLVKPFSIGQFWSELACAMVWRPMSPRCGVPMLPERCVRKLAGAVCCPRLTETQSELLRLVAAGLGQKGVAARVNSSREIVYKQLQKIYEVMGVNNSAAAVARMVACEACPGRIAPPL